jgi:hypothetical protein
MWAVFDTAAKSGREAAGRLAEIIERMKRVSNLDRADEQEFQIWIGLMNSWLI